MNTLAQLIGSRHKTYRFPINPQVNFLLFRCQKEKYLTDGSSMKHADPLNLFYMLQEDESKSSVVNISFRPKFLKCPGFNL